jgi:DNA-binding LacI/PurR family transcriptional regulator
VDELNYISTNHQEAVKRITLKRLEEFPESIPYFLKKTSDKSMLLESRETGFIEACRKKSRFYEIIKMPKEFDEKVATLDRTIPLDSSPIIMVSDTISSTGAVISWTKKNGLKFKKDLFYSDFDNNEELDIWGIRVTSFIQDYATLIDLAVNNLVKLIENKKAKVQELIFPEFIDGDT